tara:strand:- start:557 stop:1024 length:468 start_codon:yes stop_codon:yes gene_type:complete
MIKIDVIIKNKFWKNYLKNPNTYFKKKVRLLNKNIFLLKKKNLSLSIMLSDSIKIKKLNKEFRKKNKSTDVLSFPFHEKIILNSLIRKDKNKIYLGDIIVNLAKVKNKNNIDKFKIEFDKLWLHGLAHLMGHTHKTNKDFKNMQKFEKILFEAIK